ncbi:Protein ECERIFERUM 1 [Capsicum baccatum]|uniref:Protein ECERIFERUM 1 n=1 Tax=Capsicum baccatum TaxID=33114 RepID=A0A2G2VJQ5_CAPBA|nr:Protein ECERIFERUM 1 [Capsicum baccatum]
MASKPGILSEWPWTKLGNFKYLVLAPFVAHSIYVYSRERDIGYLLIFPLLLSRIIHYQIWISLSRYRTAKGNNRIVDRSIEFEQVDREKNWDDQIIFNGLLYYFGYLKMEQVHHLPLWRTDGMIITALMHIGPVEFIYYWFHRALHHHFLYSRYHSHHHSSMVTEPITAFIHPFAEVAAYYAIFTVPAIATEYTGTTSVASFALYVTFTDIMNNMGHCNFEVIPKWIFSIFPPLKYLLYTPSYHSLHHTQFRTNYSLFMPIYDYIFGTVDKSSDTLYEKSLEKKAEVPDVVHLTHLTTPQSIYHLRLGFASLASNPHTASSKWYLWLMWPVTLWSIMITWIYRTSQVVLPAHRLSKVAYSIALALCQRGIQVVMLDEEEYERLKEKFTPEDATNLILSGSTGVSKTWLVEDGLSEEEQSKAPKGTLFIPYSPFPPKKARKDCFYFNTPAMISPKHLQNVDSCENWLPRRVMSAWRIAGILHAIEGWNEHECGNMMFDIDKVWKASLDHGFSPLTMSSAIQSKA